MKKNIFLMLAFFTVCTQIDAQTQSPSEVIAHTIAARMKDSLSLTQQERNLIYDINLQLHAQKAALRSFYSDPDSLSPRFQKIENTRDSLYEMILTDDQFLKYKQKKKSLVTTN